MRKILMRAALCCLVSSPAFAKCANEPKIEFLGEGFRHEKIVVNGKQWPQSYTNIMTYLVLSDCRVLTLGRTGLQSFVAIDGNEWKNAVYNSSFLAVSENERYVMQIDRKGKIVVNDVVQPRLKIQIENPRDDLRLLDAGIDDEGNITTTWQVWPLEGEKRTVTAKSKATQ